MTNFETRAQDFLDKANTLGLSDADLHVVLDDALDIDHYDPSELDFERMSELLAFARTLFQSDDDYDDFRREVCGLLAGDDACNDCGLDPDDCECDDDED